MSAYFLPLRQGAKRVFRGMTECHSVPSEESTPQCDVGQTRRGRGYDINGKRKAESGKWKVESERYIIPPPHFVVLPLSQGEKVDGVQITDGRGGERWGWFGFQVSSFRC